jgi:hypothetical protein
MVNLIFSEKNALRSQFIKLNEPCTFNAANAISFRLYPDNRPKNLEIAALQKGLILNLCKDDLIEEGAGFGVPIVKYADYTIFSSSAELFKQNHSNNIFKKIYNMDTVSRKQIHGVFVNDKLYSYFHAAFERLYLRQSSRCAFDYTMRLRKTLGLQTQFTKIPSRGKIAITYNCLPNKINISIDFSDLDKSRCQELLLLNEQGATHFRKYSDSNKTIYYDSQIGAWIRVTAKHATFTDVKNNLSFSLKNIDGAMLYRGREQIKDRFSWAGMTYTLPPYTSIFNYSIQVST